MPEGPEARVVADQLQPVLLGKYLQDHTHLGRLEQIFTVGKQLYFVFENRELLLNSSLGMTGHWLLYIDESKVKPQHTKAVLNWGSELVPLSYDEFGNVFSNMLIMDTTVYYHDVRGFGKLTWLTLQEAEKKMKGYPHDWLQMLIPQQYVISVPRVVTDPPNMDIICNKNKEICKVLLDPKVSSGIGNYIRCEALYLAGIHPLSIANKLTNQDKDALFDAICYVMKESYKHSGLTLGDFIAPDYSIGVYPPQVYGLTFTSDGYPIIKIRAEPDRYVHVCLEKQQLIN
jgi:formamidopyrimidine-DNA glycosylase